MGQEGIQHGEVVVADVDLVRSKQRLERLPAHADIQTINARAVESRNLFILIACGCNGRERVDALLAIEKEGVSEVCGCFDVGKGLGDVFCD